MTPATQRTDPAPARQPHHRLQRLLSVLLVAASCLLAACAHPVAQPAPAHTPGAGQSQYRIGPGDMLNVVVWRNTDLSGVMPVRPDGRLTVPLVEDLEAAGKTPSELAREIERALAHYIQSPVVTVIVQSFAAPYSDQVRVLGQANKPQSLPYRQNMTLLDVLIAVGGLTDFAAGNRASIVRNGHDPLNVRLEDLVRRGDVSANVDMQPGDILVIPESWF